MFKFWLNFMLDHPFLYTFGSLVVSYVLLKLAKDVDNIDAAWQNWRNRRAFQKMWNEAREINHNITA